MFLTAEKEDLNQISLTGLRAILLLGLLMTGPKSLEEIKKTFVSYKVMENRGSDDILRIDMNSLKHVGCVISRSTQKTGHKYVLKDHPFALKLEDEDLKVLKRVYNSVKENADVELLIKYHLLFEKISKHIYQEDSKEKFLGISALKHYDIDMLKSLSAYCKNNLTLDLLYVNPVSEKERRLCVITDKLVFKNDKVYLYGNNADNDKTIVLNFRFIKKILSIRLTKDKLETQAVTVKFRLENSDSVVLAEEESILEAGDGYFIVEGRYYNEFFAIQRMLSFGSKCTVLEPETLKNAVVEKLKEMRNLYGK